MTPEHPTPEEQWGQTMADLRAHLADIRRALESGELDDIAPFAVPVGLPGMPMAYADEARSLADEQQRVQAEVRQAMDDHRPSLQRPSQPSVAFRRSRFEARA